MKVTIQLARNETDEELEPRPVLGSLEFIEDEGASIPSFVLPKDRVTIGPDCEIVLHAAYTPDNRGLSVMVECFSGTRQTHAFTGLATWDANPYFAFRLHTRHFVELYFARD